MKKILICMFIILILSVNTFAESFDADTISFNNQDYLPISLYESKTLLENKINTFEKVEFRENCWEDKDIFGLGWDVGLFYHKDSKVVFWLRNPRLGNPRLAYNYGFPPFIYYSKNGKICKYDEINKKLVEVE